MIINFKKNYFILIIVLVLICISGFWYYSNRIENKLVMQSASVSVNYIIVEEKNLPLTYKYTGRAIASNEIAIKSRVNGILVKRKYQEGVFVNKGELLYQTETAIFKANLSKAKARLEQTRITWERAKKLLQHQTISNQEYDKALLLYMEAKSDFDIASTELEYTNIFAPIDGIVSKEEISVGNVITANNDILARIIQISPLYINFMIADTDFIKQQRYVSENKITLPESKILKVDIETEEGVKQKGEVNYTDNSFSSSTGSIMLRAVIPNIDHSILPGQFVRISIEGLIYKNAITIPEQAIMQSEQGTFVFVVTADQSFIAKPIILGKLHNNLRIIEHGLEVGDKVITEGMIKLRPGVKLSLTLIS